MTASSPKTGAQVVVESLERQGVQYVFGIPGAKIDKVFDTLASSSIKPWSAGMSRMQRSSRAVSGD